MSRGLGQAQLVIKCALTMLARHDLPTRFEDICRWVVVQNGWGEDDWIEPACERSFRRALAGLVDRGEVLVIAGTGGRSNPRHYMCVETIATMATGRKVKSTAHAMEIVGEMMEGWLDVRRGEARCT